MDAYIQTFTGKKFNFLDPKPADVDIYDIAYALSNTIRWGGHCSPAISVAQHCVIVADILSEWGCSPIVQLQGLLHDGAEAYIPDIPTPIKPYFDGFKAIDDKLEAAICRKFRVPHPFDPAVKEADTESYRWEYRDLMRGSVCEEPRYPWPKLIVDRAETARVEFLGRFMALSKRIIQDRPACFTPIEEEEED